MGKISNFTRRSFIRKLSVGSVALPWAFTGAAKMDRPNGLPGENRKAGEQTAGGFKPEGVPDSVLSELRVRDIDIHEIAPPFQEFNADWLTQYYGLDIQYRAVYVVRMENGHVGYGESWKSAPVQDNFTRYIGENAYDILNSSHHTAMNMALHDAIGKSLGMPVWKLFGPKIRSWVRVAAWTASQPPEAMAEEVIHAVEKGYRWLKYHPDVLQNVVEQTKAMQEVAPSWFRIHYDFNGYSSLESIYPVLRELEQFSVAGRIEDPLDANDLEGYRRLREKCSIPILKHRGSTEDAMLADCCEGFVIAGSARRDQNLNFLADLLNMPLLFQHVGGGITQAYMAHKAAVFTMAELDHLTAGNIWTDDVIEEPPEVVNGLLQVSDRPGLGVTVDEEKLVRYSTDRPPRVYKRLLARVRYKGGPTLFFRHDGNTLEGNQRFMAFRHGEYHASPTLRSNLPPSNLPGTLSGYANPVVTEFWEDDSSDSFEEMWRRTEKGSIWVDGEPLS